MGRAVTLFFLILLLQTTQLGFTADLKGLRTLYQEHFWNEQIYRERECGPNTIRFLKLAHSKKIDLTGAKIVEIHDKGLSSLEGAHPYVAREEGKLITPEPATPPNFEVGEAEWFHHVIAVVDDHVIDFDYTNEAKIVPIRDYFFHMFLDPKYKHDLKKASETLGRYHLKGYFADFKKGNLAGEVVIDGLIKDLYPRWFYSTVLCSSKLKPKHPLKPVSKPKKR